MNVQEQTLESTRARAHTRAGDFLELTKPRITTLVVLTTWAGFHFGRTGPVDAMLLAHTLIGTALVCSGTSALNQVWERERDARMHRTRNRPLPAERLMPLEAMLFAIALSLVGILQLAIFVNPLSAIVAATTLVLYLFVYTPLKPRTWACTLVGAIPGALPPVIGWTAARGSLDAGAWALFAILFVWQLPHFYAIAWMYREDYERGGFPMIGVLDPTGRRTSLEIVSWSAALLPASLLPAFLGLAGPLYMGGALVLGIGFMALAVAMALRCTKPLARRVFLGSIVYLPVLLALLVLDKSKGL
jgi:protoheme IX farnesyltransferase